MSKISDILLVVIMHIVIISILLRHRQIDNIVVDMTQKNSITTVDEKGHHDWELFEAHFLGPLLLLLATSNYRIGLVGKKGELLSTAPGCYNADW